MKRINKMKKILLALILTVSLALTSCGSFGWDECVTELVGEGFVIMQNLSKPGELGTTTGAFNTDVLYNGGDFEVEVTRYTHLIKGSDYSRNCQLIKFATVGQAKSYASLYVETRAALNNFKVARSGAVVVLTNVDEAMEIVGLDFE